MDEWELRRREDFQREQREAREKASANRQESRQRWQEKREIAKRDANRDVAQISGEAAMDRLFADAELSAQELYHQFLYGEWAKDGDHQRELELALVELNRMEHAANLSIRVENNRHDNAKDYKTHETDELIRLKKAFGELSVEDRNRLFEMFSAEDKS